MKYIYYNSTHISVHSLILNGWHQTTER